MRERLNRLRRQLDELKQQNEEDDYEPYRPSAEIWTEIYLFIADRKLNPRQLDPDDDDDDGPPAPKLTPEQWDFFARRLRENYAELHASGKWAETVQNCAIKDG